MAIKALTPHLAMAEGFRERFEAEIESLKTLRHDGIVRLYGYGEQDGVLFYSMELVDGISLEDELKAGRRFNWREVTNIAIQLSLALKHAHDHGIVHRDIKPANILLYDDEHVKLADFGIARLFGTTSLTTAGGVLGTADYMSPEQADGRPVTARCDQYSLGGVMYALLAGRPPFRAKNLPQMLQLQRFANPEPVRRYAPDTPEQLERVIMQLLAKEPADRFPNTQVLARHLQAMVIALSRPAADDFALAGDQPDSDRAADADMHRIAGDRCDAGGSRSAASRSDGRRRNDSAESHASRRRHRKTRRRWRPTKFWRSKHRESAASTIAPNCRCRRATPPEPADPVHDGRRRGGAAASAATAVVAGRGWRSWRRLPRCWRRLVGVAMYLSRPPSADKLYAIDRRRASNRDDDAFAAQS